MTVSQPEDALAFWQLLIDQPIQGGAENSIHAQCAPGGQMSFSTAISSNLALHNMEKANHV